MRSLVQVSGFFSLACLLFAMVSNLAIAGEKSDTAGVAGAVEGLDKPLYNPFIERYVLDEIKALRTELAAQRVDYTEKLVERDLSIGDRALSYSEKTVTYFFYLIAAASSVLVLVGWKSLRDVRDKVHNSADEQIQKLVRTYEKRLRNIESTLTQETALIDQNRQQIERTQEVHALWLRAAQESGEQAKIAIYDEILKLRPNDCEALAYKADTVLELGEPLWAKNLALNAIHVDDQYVHAHYQLACAHVALGEFDEAMFNLENAFRLNENIIDDIRKDQALIPLQDHPGFASRFAATDVKSQEGL